MFYQVLLAVLGLCAAFEIKCPEPAQWSLRARLHCPNPSLYNCVLSIDGNRRKNLENCSFVDIEAPGRRIVIRFNIDSLYCSDDKYQPIKYWTNISSDCLYLTSKCTEEGQVLYSVDRYHENDISCRCDHTRGYDFVTRPKNPCFCIPSEEDCSCYRKTCSTVNSTLSRDYKGIDETQKTVLEVCTGPNRTSDDTSKVIFALLPETNQTYNGDKGNNAKTPSLVAVLLATIIFICSCVLYFRCRKEYFLTTIGPQTCTEGEECVFQCEVLDNSTDVKWFKGDMQIESPTDKYDVQCKGKERMLKVLNVNSKDAGEYIIKIKNCSRSALLTVQECFTSKFDAEKKCIEGEDCIFKCEIFNDGAEAEWLKEGKEIISSEKYKVQSNGRERSLQVNNVDMGDAGRFTIKIKGCYMSSELKVQEYFLTTIGPQTCTEGEECVFQCEVLDNSTDVNWFKGDMQIESPTDKYDVQCKGKERMLKVLNVNSKDAGEYIIKIKNCSRSALLTVQECFTSKFDAEKKCIEGEDCIFKCEIFNDGAEAEWLKEGKEIISSEKYKVQSNGRERSLQVNNVDMGDAGRFTIKIKGCYMSSELKVQELSKAVKAMSKEDIKQFIELAKKEKMEERTFFRTVIIGQEGGGKTYLKRRLLKELNEEIKNTPHKSTEGVDIDIHNIRIPIEDDGDWILDEDKNTEMRYRIATALEVKNVAQGKNTEGGNTTAKLDKNAIQSMTSLPERLNKHSDSRSNKKDNDKLTAIDEHQNKGSYEVKHPKDDRESSAYNDKVQDTLEYNATEKQMQLDEKSHTENTSTKETKQVPNEHNKSIDKMKYTNEANNQREESKIDNERQLKEIGLPLELSKYAFSKVWDFAGQKIYYPTHQAFLTSAAIYLLVVNLHDYSEKKKNCDEEEEDNFSDIKDYVDYWLDTIYCYSSLDNAGQNVNDNDKTPAELPVVLIICTHTDKCKVDELEKWKGKFQDDINTINDKKTKKIHMDRQIIYISNTQDEDKKFKEIRGRITKVAQQQVKENIPLNWILLEMKINKLVENGETCSPVDRIYKRVYDASMNMDTNMFKLFLKYQHKIGNVIFFDEKDLENDVILQPSWLIDMSKCVICHHPELQGANYDLLVKNGIIETENLKGLLKKRKMSGSISYLIDVMKKFDILIPFNDSEALYVPYMKETKMEIQDIKKVIMNDESNWEKTSWFCLKFDFLPPAFFHHILSFCTKDKMFKVIAENLYCGTCVFSMNYSSSPEKLAICVSRSTIAMQGWVCRDEEKKISKENKSQKSSFTPGLNSKVRNQIENYVSCITKRYSMDINYNVMFIHKDGNFKKKNERHNSLIDLFVHHFRGNTVLCGGDITCNASELFGPWYTSFNTSINESKTNQKDNSTQKAQICLRHNYVWRCKFKDFLKNVQLMNVSTFDAVCTCSDELNEVWKSVTQEHIALAHFVYKIYFQSRKDPSVHQEFYSTFLDKDMFCYDIQCSADRLVYVMFSKENGNMVDETFSKENKENKEITKNLRNAIISIHLEEFFLKPLKVMDKTEPLESTDVTLTCDVLDPHSDDVKWEKDGEAISKSSKYEMKHEGKTHSLIIRNCSLKDSGNYSVEVNYRETSTTLKVKKIDMPTAIQYLSEEDKRLYMDIIKTGTEIRYYLRVVIIGENGVGKTCLLRRLLKQSTRGVQSTDGIEIHGCKIRLGNGEWIFEEVSNKKEFLTRIKMVSLPSTTGDETLQLNDDNLKGIGLQGNDDTLDTSLKSTASQTKTRHTILEDDHVKGELERNARDQSSTTIPNLPHVFEMKLESESQPKQNITKSKLNMEEIIQGMDDLLNGINKMDVPAEKFVECRILDFAGQREYYATHPIFLNPNALHLLVANIMKDVKPITTEHVFDKIAGYIDFWFDAIHSCGVEEEIMEKTNTEFLYPPTIIVCTRIDECRNQLQEKKENFRKQLLYVLKNEAKRKHLREICYVSNTDSDEEDFNVLRKTIFKYGKQVKTFAEKLPLRWIRLEQSLDVLREAKMNILSWQDIVELSSKLLIDSEDEINLFLKYQHKIGGVIYFESFKEYIILNQKWLANAFRCLVSDKFDSNLKLTDEWRALENTGKLEHSLIVKLFDKEPELDFNKHSVHILNVMEIFGIIVRLTTLMANGQRQILPTYYMPCMISEKAPLSDIIDMFNAKNDDCKRTPWLCIEFDFMPLDFFNHILCYYISKYAMCTEPQTGRMTIYHGMGVFFLDRTKFTKFILCFCKNTIALQMWQWKNVEKGTCKAMLEELGGAIERVKKRFETRRVSCTVKSKCSDGNIHMSAGCHSYSELLDSGEDYFCEEHNGVHKTKDLFQTWFKDYTEKKDYVPAGKKLNGREGKHGIQDSRFKQKCHVCDKEPSVYWCHDCQRSMCQDCNNQHKESTDTKYHIVQHVQDMYSLDYNFKVNVKRIRDIKVLHDVLVIADNSDRQLVTCDITGQQQHTIPLPGEPDRVAVVDNNTVAFTLFPTTVVIVNVRQRQVMQRIDVEVVFFGIMYRDNQLFVGCNDRTIKVMNMSGKVTRTIPVGVIPDYICGGEAGRIYCTDWHKLYCIDTVGNTLFTFTDPNMSEPQGITTDDEGHVLVICNGSNNVLRISPDGKQSQVIITQIPPSDWSPYICYNSLSKSVVIGRHDNVYVYKKV